MNIILLNIKMFQYENNYIDICILIIISIYWQLQFLLFIHLLYVLFKNVIILKKGEK